MEFLARNPFFRLVIPLMGGILFQYYCHFEWHQLIIFILLIFILLAGYKFLPVKQKFFLEWSQGALILLIILASGCMLMAHEQEEKSIPPGKKITFSAEILNIPEEKDNTWQMLIKIIDIFGDSVYYKSNSRVLVYLEKNNDTIPVIPGERIIASAYPERIKNMGNPGGFNYKRYMAVKDIHSQMYIQQNEWKKAKNHSNPSLIAYSNRLRLYMLERLKNSQLSKEEFAIASALLLGYKDLLTPEIKNRFSSTGAMHILAVSGLHVGIIYLIVHYMLFFMERYKYGKISKTLIIILFLSAYAFLTGLSPSVSRATLMFSVIAIGRIFRRYSSVYNSLAFSAFILLVINPLLLFSISFQLSFAAVFSIVFFQPRIYNLLDLPPIPDKLWQWFTVALAAQIGTAPLVIQNFNQFPIYFWLTNFIAIPAAVLIILIGFIYFITSAILPLISQATSFLLNYILLTLNRSMAFIEKLPLAVAENLWFGGFQMMLLYIFIAMVSAWIILKRSLYLKMALLAMIILIVFDIGILIKRDHKKEFIVYNIPDASVYNFINGKSNCVFYSRSEEIKEAIGRFLKPYWLSKRLTECKLYNLDSIKTIKEKSLIKQNNFIGLEGLKFAFISKETDLEGLHGPKKLKLDYLILADNIKVNVKNLAQLFDFQSIILDSSNSYYYRKKLSRQLKKLGCNCYSVPEEGAFRVVFD